MQYLQTTQQLNYKISFKTVNLVKHEWVSICIFTFPVDLGFLVTKTSKSYNYPGACHFDKSAQMLDLDEKIAHSNNKACISDT